MSGIGVNEEIVSFYADSFKIRKSNAYFVCKINQLPDKKEEIQMDSYGDPYPKDCTQEQCKEVFDKMKAGLEDEEPKFIIFDFHFKSLDGRDVTQIGCISWISDNCGVKKRMKYSSTKEILPKKLQGVKSIQANDKGDLDFETVVNDLRKTK